jgi:hypothetical protein
MPMACCAVPRYRGGRPPSFTLAQRRQLKQLALSRPPTGCHSRLELAQAADAWSPRDGRRHPSTTAGGCWSEGGRVLTTPNDLGTAHPSRPPRPTSTHPGPVRAHGRARPRGWLATRRWSGGGGVRPAHPPTTSRPAGTSGRRRAEPTASAPSDRPRPPWPAAPAGRRRPVAVAQAVGHSKPRPRRGEFLAFLGYLRPCARRPRGSGSCWTTSAPPEQQRRPRISSWAAANNVALASTRPTRAGGTGSRGGSPRCAPSRWTAPITAPIASRPA